MSNKDTLLDLRLHYEVGNMEIADLSGYSYSHINMLFSSRRVPNRALKTIETALIAKYGKKRKQKALSGNAT